MKDEEVKLEEIEASHTLGGVRSQFFEKKIESQHLHAFGLRLFLRQKYLGKG